MILKPQDQKELIGEDSERGCVKLSDANAHPA